MSSRSIYAMDEFESQCPLGADWTQKEKIANRLAIRHKVGARWDANDEIEFFDVEEGQPFGMVVEDNEND